MDNQQLLDRIDKLEAFVLALQAQMSIPLEVERAFNARLQVVNGYASTKTAASATVVISGKSAMLPPDGFITIVVNGTPRNVPYIN